MKFYEIPHDPVEENSQKVAEYIAIEEISITHNWHKCHRRFIDVWWTNIATVCNASETF